MIDLAAVTPPISHIGLLTFMPAGISEFSLKGHYCLLLESSEVASISTSMMSFTTFKIRCVVVTAFFL